MATLINASDEYGRPALYGVPAGPAATEAASEATTSAELISGITRAAMERHEDGESPFDAEED